MANKRATIMGIGLEAGTERNLFVDWSWTEKHTKEFKVTWYYFTGNNLYKREDEDGLTGAGKGFIGAENTVDGDKDRDTYSAPSNATYVTVYVKPVSETYTKNGKETVYWTAINSDGATWNFDEGPPGQLGAPTVEIDDYKLTATANTAGSNAERVSFQVIQDDIRQYTWGNAAVKFDVASLSRTVAPGSKYKVRCRASRNGIYGEWSPFSSNYLTIPSVPTGITSLKATSSTSVSIEWAKVNSAETYDIEYATKREYLGASNQTSTETGIESTNFIIDGLTTGQEYFFRVRAINDQGESAWSEIKSIVLGKKPEIPTTWSSSTTVIRGEPLNLYWTHNSVDSSRQTYAEVEITNNGNTTVHKIDDRWNDTSETEKDVMHLAIDTGDYSVGAKLEWRVRTAGITASSANDYNNFSDWSIMREVNIYAPPSLGLSLTDSAGNAIEGVVESLPIRVEGTPSQDNQKPLGYHLMVVANESYETTDSIGNFKMVSIGDTVYSQNFDISTDLVTELSANNIDLEPNISYTLKCVVTMNSGLSAESSVTFTVNWVDTMYNIDAEIGIDFDTYTAHISPYCLSEAGTAVDNVVLAVYRREYDGSFVEIASGIENGNNIYVTDPHPSLDYARYRVVATSTTTGATDYYDIPAYPVGGNMVIVQWDEDWLNFDAPENDILEMPVWSGSRLMLPYNIDVSDSFSPEVSMVEYAGRKHPVSYYGTHRGVTSSWNMDIPKSDKETLYGLRRLATWMGDAYVREPSGSGYWANVVVSFNQNHTEVTIPVTLDITRVEGGV